MEKKKKLLKVGSKNCLPGGTDGKESAYNVRDVGMMPGIGKIPLEEGMATHSSILAWRIP